jgi:hypothetical protein
MHTGRVDPMTRIVSLGAITGTAVRYSAKRARSERWRLRVAGARRYW